MTKKLQYECCTGISKLRRSGMKKIFLFAFLLTIFNSCSSIRVIPDQSDFEKNLNKINYLGSRNSSEVYLTNGTRINSSFLNISKDSLIFTDSENSSNYQISVSQISRIVIKDHRMAIIGALFTGIGSAALPVLIGKTIGCKTCHPDLGPVYIGALAAVVGFIYGYYVIGEKEFIFNDI